MMQLFIEGGPGQPRSPVMVQETMPVSALIAQLVAQFGYPPRDAHDLPIRYQLRPATMHTPLPSSQRIQDGGLAPGTVLVLEACPPTATTRSVSRRAVLSTLCFAGFFGMGSGMLTALAQARAHAGAGAPLPAARGTGTAGVWRYAIPQVTFSGHHTRVRTIAWNTMGTHLASGGEDQQVLIWTSDGTLQQTLPHPAPVASLAWSPTGDRIVSGAGNRVAFFSTVSGELLAAAHQDTAAITSVAWASAGLQHVVSGSADHLALVWNTTTYQVQTRFAKHDTALLGVSWAPDGLTIASVSQGGALRVWNAENGHELHPFFQASQAPLRAVAFAPDTTTVAVGGDDGLLRFWQARGCQHTMTTPAGVACVDQPGSTISTQSAMTCLAWSPDGHYLASGHADGVVKLWRPLADGSSLVLSFSSQSHAAIASLSWSPLGDRIATAAGKLAIIWQLRT